MPQIEDVRFALLRIATLMLKVPIPVIGYYLSEKEVKELQECYVTAKEVMPDRR